jgi:hypothetical protein
MPGKLRRVRQSFGGSTRLVFQDAMELVKVHCEVADELIPPRIPKGSKLLGCGIRRSPATVALAWLGKDQAVTAVIAGARERAGFSAAREWRPDSRRAALLGTKRATPFPRWVGGLRRVLNNSPAFSFPRRVGRKRFFGNRQRQPSFDSACQRMRGSRTDRLTRGDRPSGCRGDSDRSLDTRSF